MQSNKSEEKYMNSINAIKRYMLSFMLIPALFLLVGCGSDSGSDVSCNLPCLESSPTVSIATINGATGGIVDISFNIKGDISNVNNVSIILISDDIFSSLFAAGSGVVIAPIESANTVSILIDSGTQAGTYYPNFSITANTPGNTGNQYLIDPTKSQSKYTYVEVVNGSSNIPTLTLFTVPKITVQ